MAKPRQWKCTACSNDFLSGNWLGCQGDPTRAHEVEAKTYYSIHDELNITVRCDKNVMAGITLVNIAGKDARFRGGKHTTSDPETQEVLDNKPYLLSQERYVEMRSTPELTVGRLRGQLEEKNALLQQARDEARRLREDIKNAENAKPAEEKPRSRSRQQPAA
jgi:hypothetical protein